MLNQEAAMPWNQAGNPLTASFWGCCPTDALWKFKTCHSPALVSLIFHSSCTNSPARTPNPDQRLPSDVPVTLLNVFTPRGPLLFPQCLSSARWNTSDLSLRTNSTYVDTSSHSRITAFPLNSDTLLTRIRARNCTWLHLSREPMNSHPYLNRTGQPDKAYPSSPSISLCTGFRGNSKGLFWSLQPYNPDLQPNHKAITSTQIASTLQCLTSGAHLCKLILLYAKTQPTCDYCISEDTIFIT